MKNIILAVSFCLLGLTAAIAQKIKATEVPKSVVATFTSKFPDATGAKWEKESNTEFEADFKWKGEEHSAKFDGSGSWLETETEIDEKDLPSAVTAEIVKTFAGYKLKEAEKVETHHMETIYEVELKKDEEKLEVRFDASGKVLGREEGKEKKNESK